MIALAGVSLMLFLVAEFTDTTAEAAVAGGFIALMVYLGVALDTWLDRKVNRR